MLHNVTVQVLRAADGVAASHEGWNGGITVPGDTGPTFGVSLTKYEGNATAGEALFGGIDAWVKGQDPKVVTGKKPLHDHSTMHRCDGSAHTLCSHRPFTPPVHTVRSHRLFTPSVHTVCSHLVTGKLSSTVTQRGDSWFGDLAPEGQRKLPWDDPHHDTEIGTEHMVSMSRRLTRTVPLHI